MPQGAEVLVDGRRMPGPSFELDRADDEVAVVVRSDGYRPWEKRLSAAEAATVDVELQPEGPVADKLAGRPTKGKRSTGKQQSTDTPRPRQSSPGKQSFGPIDTFGKVP